MQDVRGDLWKQGQADALVITTNSTLKRNGEIVMGAGCAKEAAEMFPELPRLLGKRWEFNAHSLGVWPDFHHGSAVIVTFPTKNQWWDKSDLSLIAQNALDLEHEATVRKWSKVVMPRLGCGYGGLSWYLEVEPMLQEILDHRFVAVTNR